ncbi:MAG: replication initiator protein [Microviridae sp.]|nr:MAG: replication initiator protein [Microviridae sp.]
MACFHPLTAWKSRDIDDINPSNGKLKMVFKPELGYPNTKTELPCGQCIGCRMDRARDWASRIMNEAQLHPSSCFITLTYQRDNYSLNKRDIQLFLKRLRRKHEDIKIRFFQCGEYGEQFERPHHHVILFGYDFPDKVPFKRGGKHQQYISRELADLWPHGLHSIGTLTIDSAMYTARYVLKKFNGEKKDEHYQGRSPEYITMSRKPGIGKEFFEKFQSDIYNHDKLVINDRLILRPAKYYDRMFEQLNPTQMRRLKVDRKKRAMENPDNLSDRRAVKEEITKLKINKLKRSIEQQSAEA